MVSLAPGGRRRTARLQRACRRPRGRALVAGLTLGHGRGEIYRAILEGTAYGVRHILEAMGDLEVPVSRVVAVGGGVRGGLWPQIVSDVVRIDQELPAVTI